MKTLQNNFTTPEQSKRLLELGVPADSADCYYGSFVRLTLRQYNTLRDGFFETYESYTPCWSVGRLIEIFIICTPFTEIRLRTMLIEQLIASYEDVIKQSMIDFSKLED